MNDVLLKNVDQPDIRSLEGYRRHGGYRALEMSLERPPEDLVAEIVRSGLRGRGGGGYPAGLKWDVVRQGGSAERLVIGNGAEGEPGSFKDRYLLSRLPHLVIEGLLIAARAVGAAKGVLFVNGTFTEEIRVLQEALREFDEAGLIGGSVEIDLFRGPHVYLAGEETALIEAMEGRPPFPRQKPPYYPSSFGLKGCPTLVNNIETLAHVPFIIRHGTEAFRRFGTVESPGTMLFSVSGDVVRPGVYEVPLGTPLRELVEGICGGVSGGRTLKAVFPGGPSYGLLVPDEIDTPLSFESLRSAGSGLGAGSVRVCADGCCMVRVALEYARFFKEGSCGQCPPCQMGTHNLVTLLERFEAGEAYPQDFSVLEDLCRFMPGRGACGLITGAALSAGSILKRFRVEFEAHREGKSCPFGS